MKLKFKFRFSNAYWPPVETKAPISCFTRSHILGDLGNKRDYPLTHFEYLVVRVSPQFIQVCYCCHLIYIEMFCQDSGTQSHAGNQPCKCRENLSHKIIFPFGFFKRIYRYKTEVWMFLFFLNPAYWRHQLSRPMGIVGPIQISSGCVIYLEEKK